MDNNGHFDSEGLGHWANTFCERKQRLIENTHVFAALKLTICAENQIYPFQANLVSLMSLFESDDFF